MIEEFKKYIAGRRNEKEKAQVQLNILRAERGAVLKAPPTRGEVVSALCSAIDTRAERYPDALRSTLDGLLNDTVNLNLADGDGWEGKYMDGRRVSRLIGSRLLFPKQNKLDHSDQFATAVDRAGAVAAAHEGEHEAALMFMCRDVIKKAVTQTVLTMSWPAEEGLPLEKRRAKIEELTTKIQALELRINELQKEEQEVAGAVGGTVHIGLR